MQTPVMTRFSPVAACPAARFRSGGAYRDRPVESSNSDPRSGCMTRFARDFPPGECLDHT